MCRLHRFLLSNKLIEYWNVKCGPKPFRFNNIRFNHELLKPFIKEELEKNKVAGRGDFILYDKLKCLKHPIIKWNRDVFWWIDLKVSQKVGNLNELDILLVDHFGGNVEELVVNRRKVTEEIWNTLNLKESMIRLKSGKLWLDEGDKNTHFFHKSLKERYRINAIYAVEGENGIEEGWKRYREL